MTRRHHGGTSPIWYKCGPQHGGHAPSAPPTTATEGHGLPQPDGATGGLQNHPTGTPARHAGCPSTALPGPPPRRALCRGPPPARCYLRLRGATPGTPHPWAEPPKRPHRHGDLVVQPPPAGLGAGVGPAPQLGTQPCCPTSRARPHANRRGHRQGRAIAEHEHPQHPATH